MTISDYWSLAGGIYLFGAHEEEMLDSVGHSWHIIGVAKASNIDVDSSASFVCFWVMNKKGFELVG